MHSHDLATILTYLSRPVRLEDIVKQTIRTSLDIPAALHRRLHEAAARQGCSARQMILRSIEHAIEGVEPKRPIRRFEPDPALIAATGKPIDFTNEQIYELIEFP